MEWTDATSYSQNSDRIQTAWQYKNKRFRVYITNAHRMNPGRWTMHCHEIGIDTHDMKIDPTATPEQAQQHAIKVVRNRLQQFLAEITIEPANVEAGATTPWAWKETSNELPPAKSNSIDFEKASGASERVFVMVDGMHKSGRYHSNVKRWEIDGLSGDWVPQRWMEIPPHKDQF